MPMPAGTSCRRPRAPRKNWPRPTRTAIFTLDGDGQLRAVSAGDPRALVAWRPGDGWEALLADRRSAAGVRRSLSADLQRHDSPADHRRPSRPEPRRVHRHACRRVALGDRRGEHPAHASAARALRRRDRGRRHRGGRRPAAHDAARRRPQPAARRPRSGPAPRRRSSRLRRTARRRRCTSARDR